MVRPGLGFALLPRYRDFWSSFVFKSGLWLWFPPVSMPVLMGFGPAVTLIFFGSLSCAEPRGALAAPRGHASQSSVRKALKSSPGWGQRCPKSSEFHFAAPVELVNLLLWNPRGAGSRWGWRSFAVPQNLGKSTQRAQTETKRILPGGFGGKGLNVGQRELGAASDPSQEDGAASSWWNEGEKSAPI